MKPTDGIELTITITRAVFDTLNEACLTGLYGQTIEQTAAEFVADNARNYLLISNPRALKNPGQRRAQLARRKSATRRR